MVTFPLMPKYIAVRMLNENVLPHLGNLDAVRDSYNRNILEKNSLYPTAGIHLEWSEISDMRRNIDYAVWDYDRISGPRLDRKMYRLVHDNFSKMTPGMAARQEVWNLMNVGLFPHIIVRRWKNINGAINTQRFFSPTRNYIGTIWWRVFFFYDKNSRDPYWLLDSLKEDDFVQIMERVKLRGYSGLAKAIGTKIREIREDARIPAEICTTVIRQSIIDIRIQALNIDFNGVDNVYDAVSSTFERIRKEREREYLESPADFKAKYK